MLELTFLAGLLLAPVSQEGTDRPKDGPECVCGTCALAADYNTAIVKARKLEASGDLPGAVTAYVRTLLEYEELTTISPDIAFHVAELYVSAGQTADLSAILEVEEKRFAAGVSKRFVFVRDEGERKPNGTRKAMEDPPSLSLGLIHRSIEFVTWRREQSFEKIAAVLKAPKSGNGPLNAEAELDHWEAVLAAKVLALNPEKAVPLLKLKCDSGIWSEHPWAYYSLGLCGTPEAVKILEEHVAREPYIGGAGELIFALSFAGDLGRKVLSDLQENGSENFKKLLRKFNVGRPSYPKVFDSLGNSFPPIPQHLHLPLRLQD